MEPYAEERQVQLQLNLENAPSSRRQRLRGRVDGKAIQQALMNLVDNAIKHSPSKSCRDDRCSSREPGAEANADVTQLWVEDHGPGIPADEHEKIFERFYRLGSELRRETQGVGIGLSIVKHIVEAHGGQGAGAQRAGAGEPLHPGPARPTALPPTTALRPHAGDDTT